MNTKNGITKELIFKGRGYEVIKEMIGDKFGGVYIEFGAEHLIVFCRIDITQFFLFLANNKG